MSPRLGCRGEQLAADYLQRKGYHLVERNFRAKRSEIDIIARQGSTLVFVEVKTAQGSAFGSPRCWVDGRKQARLIRAAMAYLSQNQMEDAACRFDVIAIRWSSGSAKLTHIINAFSA